MPALIPAIQWFFWIIFAFSISLPWFRRENREQWRPSISKQDLKSLGVAIAPLILLYGSGLFLKMSIAIPLGFALLGLFLPWGLSRIHGNIPLRGTVLLGIMVLTTILSGALETFNNILIALFFGMAIFKIVIPEKEGPLKDWSDIIPASIWLLGLYWINITVSAVQDALYTQLLLGSLGVIVFLGLLQSWTLPVLERWFLKPLFLAVMGGLGLFWVVNHLLITPNFTPWAGLVACGVILSGIFSKAFDEQTSELKLPQVIILFALIGMTTFSASRLLGGLSWVILPATFIIFPFRRASLVASFFLLGRAILQLYIVQYNSNVTGINVTHPYASAALYAGFVSILILPWVFSCEKQSPVHSGIWVIIALFVGAIANYFLQAEAVCSLLLAMTLAGLTGAVLSPLYDGAKSFRASELQVAFPIVTLIGALTTVTLADSGVAASRIEKLTVLSIIAGVLVVIGVAYYWFIERQRAVKVS